MAYQILNELGHVIPDQAETDVHTAYALIRRNVGTFEEWLAKPKEAEAKLAEILAEEKAKAEPKPKFDPTDPKFQTFAKANPKYAELARQAKEADTDEKRQAVKKACSTFFDEMKKAYLATLKKAA